MSLLKVALAVSDRPLHASCFWLAVPALHQAAQEGVGIRLIRTIIEGFVLVLGMLLGGTVGVGTLLVAFGVGHVIQAGLRIFDREGRVMQAKPPAPA